MAEPWEEAQAKREAAERQREETREREERQREAEQRQREAEQRKREEERDKRQEENEGRERARSEAAEKRDQEREAREGAERQAGGRIQQPPGYSLVGGGGPSFLLSVPQSMLEVNTEIQEAGGFPNYFSVTQTNYSEALLGSKVVAPGSLWSIAGGYLKLPFQVGFLAAGNLAPKEFTALSTLVTIVVTITRGVTPVYIGTSTAVPVLSQNPEDLPMTQAAVYPVIGVEYNSPLVLGPGENLSMSISYNFQASWAEVKEAKKVIHAFMNTVPLGNSRFGTLLGNGAFRYNIESKKEENRS